MKLRSPVILGLAFDDRSVACAEVTSRGESREQRRLGRFVYPAGATLAEPAACGAALRAFLDEHGFTATRAVAGVPARWLIAAERELPPSDPASSLAVLRMQGERMALAGGSELVVDVAGEVTRDTTRALIVGILRTQIDRLGAIAAAAGLSLDAITSTALVAHAVSGVGNAPLVLVGDSGVELVAGEPGSARLLRHVSTANVATESGVAQLGSELKRTLALAGQSSGRISLLDGGRLGESRRGALAERAGVAIDRAQPPGAPLAADALNGAADGLGADAFAPAVALAIAAASKPPLPVDFSDSRLAPIVARRFGRRAAWGVVIAVAAVIAFVLFYTTLLDHEERARLLAEEHKAKQPTVDAAKAFITRVDTGRAYYEKRPPMLGAMRAVANAFEYEQPIWATSLTFRDNNEGVLQGKTTSQNLAFGLRDRLAASPSIKDVKLGDFRGAAGSKAGEQTFTINFTYTGSD